MYEEEASNINPAPPFSVFSRSLLPPFDSGALTNEPTDRPGIEGIKILGPCLRPSYPSSPFLTVRQFLLRRSRKRKVKEGEGKRIRQYFVTHHCSDIYCTNTHLLVKVVDPLLAKI